MARQCYNCGCELPLLGKTYKLKNQKIEFCADCGQQVDFLLKPVLTDIDKSVAVLAQEFEENLALSKLTSSPKRAVQWEFDDHAANMISWSSNRKEFLASFQCSYNLVENAISDICSSMGEKANADMITVGETKVVTFLLGDYTSLLENAFTSMSVVLVHHHNKAIVMTKGTSEYLGNYKKLNKKFWAAIRKAAPELDIKTVYIMEEIELS